MRVQILMRFFYLCKNRGFNPSHNEVGYLILLFQLLLELNQKKKKILEPKICSESKRQIYMKNITYSKNYIKCCISNEFEPYICTDK